MDTSRTLVAAVAVACGCAAVWVAVKDYRAAHPARPAVTAVAYQDDDPSDVAPPQVPAASGPSGPAADAATGDPVEASAVVAAAPDPGRAADALPRKARKPRARLRLDGDARRRGASTPAPRPAATNPQAAANPPAAERAAVARRALALVGSDPEAEEVWMEAINDPSRSDHERSDLIEDLNEEGFADPRHLTPDDLPLIERRLALIEQLAPQAMDDTNAAAFEEAYKDLLNMYEQMSGE